MEANPNKKRHVASNCKQVLSFYGDWNWLFIHLHTFLPGRKPGRRKLKVVGQWSSILIIPIPILTNPIPIPIFIISYEALRHFHIIPHNVPAYILKRSLKSCSISIFFVIRIYRIIYSNISNETIWCGKHRILGFSMLLILAVNGPHKPKTFLLECDCMVLCLHMCVCVSFFQDACHQCLCFL